MGSSEELILLDTHMWIYFHQGNPKLPETVADAFRDRRADLRISVVSIWETLLLLEKGRVKTPYAPSIAIERWLDRVEIGVVTLTSQDVLLSRTLPFTHDDPADRFIAATAHRLGATLATDDRKLLDLRWLRTVA